MIGSSLDLGEFRLVFSNTLGWGKHWPDILKSINTYISLYAYIESEREMDIDITYIYLYL